MFQHTAARRRLLTRVNLVCCLWYCFNTQPHGGGCLDLSVKAAVWYWFQHTAARRRLLLNQDQVIPYNQFQHTAARRRLHKGIIMALINEIVSTHSRTEAAAHQLGTRKELTNVSTHSRTEAAAYVGDDLILIEKVSTHSRTEAAAFHFLRFRKLLIVSTHSRTEAAAFY